jgi:6-phosphogluconolactonase
MRFEIVDDKEAAAAAAARYLTEAAEAGGAIALSGGGSVGRAYELAAGADWSRARIWWNDDRCVPPDDDRSNYRLAREKLLDRLAAPPAEVHRIRGELEPERAAALYDRELEGVVLDLTLQGIGPDGHTASLFPGMPSLDERDRRAISTPAGHEPYVDRVTMTLPMLNATRLVLFLVTGAEKAEAVERAFGRDPSPETPSSLVRSEAGETVAILDRAAAARLDAV